MPEWTLKDIVLAIGGSGGLIVSLIAAFKFIAGVIDERKQRKQADRDRDIANAIEFKRLEAESDSKTNESALTTLWRIVEDREREIADLRCENDDLEKTATLHRPLLNQVNAKLRAMRKEIESLNLLVLNEEETNIFMRRMNKVKELLDETEAMLP